MSFTWIEGTALVATAVNAAENLPGMGVAILFLRRKKKKSCTYISLRQIAIYKEIGVFMK